MSKAAIVEIDFFRMELQKNAPRRAPSSSRGIQDVVSRINPEMLKAVMAAGGEAGSSGGPAAACRSTTPPAVGKATAAARSVDVPPPAAGTAPLTIFYGGAVFTFDVPRDRAASIMEMAETGYGGNLAPTPEEDKQVEGDLPMARRKSLQRFMEKRKERVACAFPYHKKVGLHSHPC